MTPELIVRRVIPIIALISATLLACRDVTHPLAPRANPGKVVARNRHGIPIPYAIQCRGRRSKRTFSCTQAVPKLAGREQFMPHVRDSRLVSPRATSTRARSALSKDVVIGGGQGQYITLATSDYAFDTISNIFSLDATVQNDLLEPLGTPDGSTTTGIKVFVSQLYATVGTGATYVANPDGTDTFTATNQPYWLYNQMLAPGQVSNSRNWQIYLAPTVDDFYIVIETYAGFPAEFSVPATAPDTTVDSIYANSYITNSDPNYTGKHLFNAVTVDFARDTSTADRALAIAAVGGTVVGGWDYLNDDGFYVIRIPGDSTGVGVAAAISTLESLPQVATASPEFILDTNALEYRRPRDHFQPSDWHWNPDNPATDTTWAFSRVEAPLAWGCDTGSTTTRVAVVDNNFPDVPDLDTNAAGTAWTSLTDTKSDHGVAMASIIAAQGNNGIGMAGMMWRVHLRLYDVGGTPFDTWTPERAIAQLARAAEDSARVINLSQDLGFGMNYLFGTKADSSNRGALATANMVNTMLDTAILRADSNAHQQPVYVISAGNESCGSDRTNPWWGAFATLETLFPGRVLVVEWTDTQDKRANCSNYGQYVNIAAPGDSVMRLKIDGTIGLVGGSSPSAALVTGAVGLLFAFDSSMSPMTAVSYITQGATNGGRHTNDATPVPILNAYESLKLVSSQAGKPLCNNRLWSTGGFIYAARGSAQPEAIASTGGLPAWNVIAMHGGHRLEFTTLQGRYSVTYTTGTGWGTPVQVQDSATAFAQAPFSGPSDFGGYFIAQSPTNGDSTAGDSILGGTGRSVWAYNHDGDSSVAVLLEGGNGTDSVVVIRGAAASVLADTGSLDTVGVITYPSITYVDYGCGSYSGGVCQGEFMQPNRVDFVHAAYAPRGDRILVAWDHDAVNVATSGYRNYGLYQVINFTIDIVSSTVQAVAFSLPSKDTAVLTIPSGYDVWWWGISEADSTIVAGMGVRDYREVDVDSATGYVANDFTTNCSVDFRSANFQSLLLSVPTSDACSSAFQGGPAPYGSGTISPNRVKHAPPRVVAKPLPYAARSKSAVRAYPHP